MRKELHTILDSYHQEMIGNLRKLIKIRSVVTEATVNAPFGKDIQESLDFILSLGEKKGFSCKNYDNYICEITLGKEAQSVGAVLHLDVVPEGDGWTYPPFDGALVDGRIYGRGAVDDKGPLIAVFYACLAIKESGLPLKKAIKQIIGTNEENGVFPCLKHYLEHGEVPSCGIVPDAWFPAVYAEKGFLNIEFKAEIEMSKESKDEPTQLISMKGGEAINVVAPSACAKLEISSQETKMLYEMVRCHPRKDSIQVVEHGDSVTISTIGKSAHASTPELGINAIALLLEFLEKLPFGPGELKWRLLRLSEMVARDSDGTGLGVAGEDHTGALTQNPGLISYDNSKLDLKLNLRSPVSMSPVILIGRLNEKAEATGMICDQISYNPPFYIEPTHPLVVTLTQVYREMTGDYETEPKAHGAGSYARMLDGFVPFGPSIQGEELCFHKQDEYIDCQRLLLLSKIYAEALYTLANEE